MVVYTCCQQDSAGNHEWDCALHPRHSIGIQERLSYNEEYARSLREKIQSMKQIIDWVINDASYKAPEQAKDCMIDYIQRLRDASQIGKIQ